MTQELKTYLFTDEDINLITFAVRRLSETTDYLGIKEDTQNLLAYIERMKKEQLYLIKGQFDKDSNEQLYWSNTDGWVDISNATLLTKEEIQNPPIGHTGIVSA